LQEAVAVGLEAALSKEDDVISTYRCHGLQYIRGDTVRAILAEMYGFSSGSSKGKGGSMHLYSRKNKFWGGAGACLSCHTVNQQGTHHTWLLS
jgi:pyruvate dehydrogenase E1 component alpha subunit